MDQIELQKFWHWFGGIASSLQANIENHELLHALDQNIRHLDPMLSWEIGPGAVEPWQLVISPNLAPNLRAKAQEIVSKAPTIQGWEFYPARRPKAWDYKFLLDRSDGRSSVEIDASDWEFVLLQYPDGNREILLHGKHLGSLDNDERWQAAAITLESILGEEVYMEKISDFELLDYIEPRFAQSLKPIQQLRDTVLRA